MLEFEAVPARIPRTHQILNLGARLEKKHWAVSPHVSNATNTLYNAVFSSGPELGALGPC
jgi:hypothetical protein